MKIPTFTYKNTIKCSECSTQLPDNNEPFQVSGFCKYTQIHSSSSFNKICGYETCCFRKLNSHLFPSFYFSNLASLPSCSTNDYMAVLAWNLHIGKCVLQPTIQCHYMALQYLQVFIFMEYLWNCFYHQESVEASILIDSYDAMN